MLLLLLIADLIVMKFVNDRYFIPVILLSLLCIPLLYYILIYSRAKKFIRTRYQLRSFAELTTMRRYLLYAYLEKVVLVHELIWKN